MRTTKTIHAITRAALMLIVMLTMTLTASATDFITDVLVIGHNNQDAFNNLKNNLVSAGWTDIPQDLNQNAGGAYIHLLYKKQSSTGNTGTPITGFYIKTGNNPPDELTDQEGHTYYLVPCQGSDTFVSGHGDLNSGCGGNSAYIYLYYTKDVMSDNKGVTGITFNTTQNGAVGANGGTTGYDLNSGGGGAYIYMHLTTATGANVVPLISESGNVQLLNGHTLTGTGGADTQVSVADGATVTLSGVNLTAIADNNQWPGIHCLGNATIVLNGGTTNSVSGGFRSPGIYVAANKTLTIQGNGTLTATGRDYAAGIGSGQSQSSCGNITISGGTVTANGGQNAAGIGSGAEQQSCGNITISGGTVNATGRTWATGIGSGFQSSCGTITISGGTVTANGGLYAAAIGSGYSQASCGNITITNGVTRVTATKHSNSSNTVGAGNSSSCGTVTIGSVTGFITMSPFVTYPYTVSFNANGGTGTMTDQAFMYNVAQNLTANAFTNWGHPFLGWATSPTGPKVYNDGQSVSNLAQSAGATVTLYAKWANKVTLTDQIGEVLLQNGDTLTGTGGQNTRVKIADGATVIFSGANITTIAENTGHQWPGIHCLGNATIILKGGTTNSVQGGYFSSGIYVAENKTLTIQGNGTLNTTGRNHAAGIGSGQSQSSCGNITISGGTIIANGGQNASGIGSGAEQQSCGNITISGGTVNATGLTWAAGIGSGNQSSCGTITISGGTVTATGGIYAAAIGSGYSNASCGTITITNGVTRVTATRHNNSTYSVGAGKNSSCGTVTIGGVQTGSISMSSFVTYPYTVSFNANGGTGTMNDQAFMYNVAQHLTANDFTYVGCDFQGWATSANGPKVYNNGESVSNLTDTPGATVTLYAKWLPDPEHLSIDGNTYTIHSETGWDIFCNLLAVNDNGYFTGKTVKLAKSISVTTMAGSSGHEFSGIFDGQSDTLAVNYQNINGAVYTAPFSYVNGATIRNLIVAGSITGTGQCSGIVGETGSSLSHITNCVSSANVSGGNTAGISMGSNVEITGCVFNGMITGTNMSSGFVGSSDSALVISNSLFAPQVNSSISGGTFYNNDGGGEMTLVNSYYTVPLGTPQGKQARSIVGGEHVTVAFNGQATTYNTSGITAYSVGMVYGNTLYAGNGDTVSLNLSCTPPSGYVCSGYTPSAGTLTGTANPYTLAMPDAAVTIQALKQVAYIDSDGQTLTCSEYTVLTSNETTLEAGWYVVDHDITYNSTLTLNGNVNLILCNGKTMTVTTNSGNSIAGSALTIYGQTLDSSAAGTLNVTNNVEEKEAIELFTYAQHSGNVEVFDSNDDAIRAHDNFTFNGGSVNATIVNGDANGIYATNDITINGGTVNATGSSSGIYADNVTINGGTVNSISTNHIDGIIANNVTINGGTITSDNIWSPTVTLGWSNITDCITVSSFSYAETPTVSVKSGQAFYYENGNETVTVRGTLNSDQINAIGGKTLRPLTPVSYVDGNGDPHTCDNYTVLNSGSATTLTEGWYVVNQDITNTGTITLNGNVNLILCNGKTMTVNPGSGNSISGDTLTIYGQTLDSVTAGTLYVTDTVESKRAIKLSTYTQHSGNVEVNDSSDFAISVGDFTLNGGTVNATSTNYCGISAGNVTLNGGTVNATGSNGIDGGNVTINGGTVNANGDDYGIYSESNVTINGGTVNATGDTNGIGSANVTINGGTVNATSATGIKAGSDIILGWTHTDDYIFATSYVAFNGTVSVKSGQAFCYQNGNETVIISGTLNSDQINAIGGKTLVPCVTYVDGNGETRFCTDFTVLEGGEATTLAAGWYVVDQDITYTGTLTLAGDVTLILCNGKTMTINPESGNSIYGLINMGLGYSLTIYGQTLDSDTAGTLQVTNNDEDKNAIELFTYIQHSGKVVVSDSSDDAILAYGDFTLNGGTVNVTAYGNGIYAYDNVTLNGGTVNTTSIAADGNVTINGGTVNVTAYGNGIYAYDNVTINGGTVTINRISSFTVTLGWSNLTDCITIGSFNINLGDKSAGVSVKSGQAFYFIDLLAEELVVVSGTLNSDQIEAISGKTLRPYISVTQTIELSSGWNWFSTYIEMDPVALLEALEAQLGENGLQIVSKGKVTSYDPDEEEWGGGLQSIGITNGNTYMIEMDTTVTSVTVTLEGPASVPGDYTITINKGWNWIGFPCAEQVAINVALAGFEAEPDDEIVSKGKASSYDADEEEWGGSLLFLKPGEGYMYNSHSATPKTLVFQTGGGAK